MSKLLAVLFATFSVAVTIAGVSVEAQHQAAPSACAGVVDHGDGGLLWDGK